jgi:huntingtin
LERLLLCEVFSIKDGDLIVRTAINKVKSATNQTESFSAVRIIITSIYVFGLSIGNETNGAITDSNEDLLLAMEKIGVLFDRLKVCGANEAYTLASIIPNMLYDFFPTQDILNKIIGEFLSSQHFYPQNSALIIFKVMIGLLYQLTIIQYLLCATIFQVFNNLHSQSQESLIHEWVVLSLSSFIQIQPLASAIWSLSSFLISASSNIWIKNLYA